MSAPQVPESSPLSETRLEEIESLASWLLDENFGPLAVAHDSQYGPRLTGDDAHALVTLLAEIRRLQSALAAASEETDALRGNVYAWLGFCRDHMRAEDVESLQRTLGPLSRSLTPGADDGQ